jgi:hypothetical protein
MRRWILVVCGCAFVGLQPVRAQVTTGAPRAAAAAGSPARLPVRRVVLYKNGVGYFEHLGRVRGTQTLSIAFNTSQLNDVLKSLTTVDLGNGRIADVSFNSDAPLARRLDAFALPLGDKPTLVDLLGALRGTRLELRAPGRVIVGRLLGVERRRAKDDVPKDEVTLVSDAGELRSIELTPAVTVKLAERASVDQVSGYLGLLASTRGQDRRTMTISAVGDGSRDVMVGYVSEVPVWKTTYRIVLPANAGAAPILQGWAIVDNTIGEDWNDVELSLVAGAPQSFVQPLSQPVYTQRPVVGVSRAATPAPQVHAETSAARGSSLSGRVVDQNGAALPGAAVTASATTGRRFTAVTDGQGRYAFPTMPAGNYRVEFVLAGFQNVTIERIYLDSTPRQLQDTVLAIAAISETVTVTGAAPRISDPRSSRLVAPRGGGAMAGDAAAAPSVDRAAVEERVAEMQATARGEAVGDLFEYRVAGPITIRMNQSALVPILASNIALERVSLWNDRIGGARPLRSVWLTNTSGMTLDGGSFTVLDAATFAGEGLIEPMKPGEKRLLSYAIDLGVQVDAKNGDDSQRVSRIQIVRGVASVRNEKRSRKVYSVRNNDAAARTVVIEHPIRAGWTLVSPAPVESSLTSYRFAVSVGPNASATLVVDERRPISTELAIADLTDQQIALYVADNGETMRLKEALGPIQSKKAQIASLTASYEARQEEAQRLNDDQLRLRENMRALKGSAGERRLLKRYVGQLDEEEDRIAVLQRECSEIDARIGAARDELAAMIERLSLDLDVDDAARQ